MQGGEQREFPTQWGGAKINININNIPSMTEALDHAASELLEHIAKEEGSIKSP